MAEDRSPGWLDAVKLLPSALIPFVGLQRIMGRQELPTLTVVRATYLATIVYLIAVAPILILVVGRQESSIEARTALWIVVGLTALGAAGVFLARRRSLDTSSFERLQLDFRSSFALGLAAAVAPVLLSVYVSLVAGRPEIYLATMWLAIPSLLAAAPTRGFVANHQRRLDTADVSLIKQLSASTSTDSRRNS